MVNLSILTRKNIELSLEVVSVIIVTWNSEKEISNCLSSLRNDLEVIVVDNCSQDRTKEIVRKRFPNVKLLENPSNLGFAEANNRGIRVAKGEYILLLNPDTVVREGSIEKMVEFMNTHPDVGVIGPKLLNRDGSIQPSCREFPSYKNILFELTGIPRVFPRLSLWRMGYFNHNTLREVDQPMGACLLIRRDLLREIGGFDETFPIFMNDVDLCYRIKNRGWKVLFFPEAEVFHFKGKSTQRLKARKIIIAHRSLYQYFKKHKKPPFIIDALIGGILLFTALLRIMFSSGLTRVDFNYTL